MRNRMATLFLVVVSATLGWAQSVQGGRLVDRGGAVYSTGAAGSLVFGDNRYCGKGDIPAFGAAFDGPAQLPIACIYTGSDGTPSGKHLDGATATTWQVRSDTDTVRCTVGPPDNGNCAVPDWNAALLGVQCGDVILLEHGAVMTGNFVLPGLPCDAGHWVTVESDSVVTDTNFPAEGTRATPCHIGQVTLAYYPSYPCASPANRMAKFVTPTQLAAITTNGCNVAPCTQFWRFIGIEATNTAGVRSAHKLLEMDGADHMIVDRSIVHGTDAAHPPNGGAAAFDVSYEAQGGVSINGTFLAVIDSWVYDIFCMGNCIDAQGVAGGTGQYAQRTQKIVNNMIAASGESWFWGGGPHAHLCDAVTNVHCTNTDIEVRRNHSFKPLSWFLAKGGSGNHPLTKNLGETKASDRSLWEGNISENSFTGWQSDQFGNAHLLTPKSQAVIVQPGTASIQISRTGCPGAACHIYADASVPWFTCDSAASSQYTNPAGANYCNSADLGGTTMVAFQGLPGEYPRSCPSTELSCRLGVPKTTSSTRYHIKQYVATQSPDHGVSTRVELWDEGAATIDQPLGTLAQFCKRGSDPYAAVYNHTLRYELDRHTADLLEVLTAESDCGDNAQGIHNVSIHDVVGYDINPQFWQNAATSGCCTLGWNMKLESATTDPSTVPEQISYKHNSVALTGWQGNHSGMMNWFDQKYDANTAPNLAAFFSGITIKDNISSGPFAISAGVNIGSSFLSHVPGGSANGPVSEGLAIYACSGHDGTGCNYDIKKNLILEGIVAGQLNNTADLHLLGSNTVEACGCTTAANGGTCTAGNPNTWATPVTAGTADACDRTVSGYGDVFTNYDPNGGPTTDLTLKSGSPYLGQASDGGNFGADVAGVLLKTQGVASAVNFGALAITTVSLPAGTNGVAYSQQVQSTAGASPYKLWTLVSGTLPAGLALSLGDGAISGTPTAACTASACTFAVQVQDAGRQVDTRTLSIAVN